MRFVLLEMPDGSEVKGSFWDLVPRIGECVDVREVRYRVLNVIWSAEGQMVRLIVGSP